MKNNVNKYEPLVSVIIPNYCHSKFLDERIQSVLNQTYQNIEVLILDDCSPDNGASRKVIENYREDKRVSKIIYNKENGGSPYKQWKKGADEAKGDLIWIAESDDSCDIHLLETLVPFFNQKDTSVAFCRSVLFNELGFIGNTGPENLKEGVIDGKLFIHEYLLIGTGIVNASSAIFSRSAYNDISDIFTTFRGSGDHLFWILLAEKGNVAFAEKPYNFFRTHSNNTTSQLTGNGLMQIEDKRIFDYLCNRGHISRKEKRHILRETMRINVFQLYTDPKLKKQVYKVWGFGLWQQYSLKIEAWSNKLKCICNAWKNFSH